MKVYIVTAEGDIDECAVSAVFSTPEAAVKYAHDLTQSHRLCKQAGMWDFTGLLFFVYEATVDPVKYGPEGESDFEVDTIATPEDL